MKRNFIAKRFQSAGTGLTLDTAALAKYKDIVDLSIGDTDFTTDEAIINAAFRDAKAGHTHYGDPKGDPELISAVCKAWEEDFDQSLPRDHVLVSASSCLCMSLAMFAILDPGDEVIVFSPYFALYRAQIELAGGVCVDVPTYAEEDYAISEERLRAAITPRTKAIIFNNPTNPTGMGYDLSTMEMLARVAKEYDLLIAADEIYTTYIYEGDFRPIRTLPGMAERTITLNSFSKNFLMTGWRVGVIIAEPELLEVMHGINGSLVYSAPSISQRAGIQALAMRKEIREKYVTAYRDRIFYSADLDAWADHKTAADLDVLHFILARGEGLVQKLGKTRTEAVVHPVAGLHSLDSLLRRNKFSLIVVHKNSPLVRIAFNVAEFSPLVNRSEAESDLKSCRFAARRIFLLRLRRDSAMLGSV